jgi:hypothetical protein
MDDLETAEWRARIDALERNWRDDAAWARRVADGMQIGEDARYQAGYADALDRCVQALRGLEQQW